MNSTSQFSTANGLSRRSFFQHVGAGIYGAALWQLLNRDASANEASKPSSAVPSLLPRPPHHAARAKSVIHLFMNGGPSQMDLFDPKPELDKHHGEAYFDKIAGEVENVKDAGALMRSPFKFAQHGACGMWVSDALPQTARHVDDLALVRSLFTTNITHEVGHLLGLDHSLDEGGHNIMSPTVGLGTRRIPIARDVAILELLDGWGRPRRRN